MIKLYITAIESKEDGSAVTLFEDLLVVKTRDQLEFDSDSLDSIESFVLDKIKEVEAINEQVTSPF